MSTLEVEMDIKSTVQATEAVELIDCGRATERTNGVPFLLFWEASPPPSDRLLLF